MKKILEKWIFSPADKTITFPDRSYISLSRLMLITNVTTNTIIYNFADSTLGGVVSGNAITLTYSTTAMHSGDELMIIYDEQEQDKVEQLLQAQLEILEEIKELLINKIEEE